MSANISRDLEILLLPERDEASVALNLPVKIVTEIDATPTITHRSMQEIFCRL